VSRSDHPPERQPLMFDWSPETWGDIGDRMLNIAVAA
jgi:hypothetical protein